MDRSAHDPTPTPARYPGHELPPFGAPLAGQPERGLWRDPAEVMADGGDHFADDALGPPWPVKLVGFAAIMGVGLLLIGAFVAAWAWATSE
jgi:hypothetical protein